MSENIILNNISDYVTSFHSEVVSSTSGFDFELEEKRNSLNGIMRKLSTLRQDWKCLSRIQYDREPERVIKIIRGSILSDQEKKKLSTLFDINK